MRQCLLFDVSGHILSSLLINGRNKIYLPLKMKILRYPLTSYSDYVLTVSNVPKEILIILFTSCGKLFHEISTTLDLIGN